MRKIKFRGMSLNGEWHYGNLAILTKKVGSYEAGSYISNSLGLPFAYDVRPETVGQFTGEVCRADDGQYICGGYTGNDFDELEIIGNIYSNPELLGGVS